MTNWQEQFDERFPPLPSFNDVQSIINAWKEMSQPPMTATEVILAEQEARRRIVIREEIKYFIQFLLDQQRKELLEKIKLPEYDHSKCPIPQTCIGYQNAESDLEALKQFLTDGDS